MIKQALLAVAALAALTSSACAQSTINPALYVVRDADSTMYLFGTVHVRPNGAEWADDDVRAALAASEEIWTEVIISPQNDAQTQALALQLGRAPADRPLSSWLSEEDNARLDALTQRLGVPRAALEQMQPWMAGLTLTLIPVLQAGYDAQSGVDRQVDAFGDANGKTMRAFETAEDQLGFFSGLSDETQRQILLEAIDEADAGVALINQMSTAWEQGDVETLEELVIDSTREEYAEMYEALFVRRNNAWMETLVAEMQGAGVDFVAVGAGHLIGAEGLVEQFRARGFTVEQVE